MVNMNVTYDDLRQVSAQLKNGKAELEQKLAELGSAVDNLVSNGFQTDHASHSYRDQFHQFQQGTTQAISALEGLASFLDAAAQTIEGTDTQLASSIQGQ